MSNEYRKIEFDCGCRICDAVEELLKYRNKGYLVFGEFNGVKLYSDTVTIDGAYKEITGRTKSEFDESIAKSRVEYEEQKRVFENQIPENTNYWSEKGKQILTPDKWDYWCEIVPIRLKDIYQGMELGCCLDIISILNNGGSFSKAKHEIEKQNHSGMSFGLVCSMIREFSEKGNDFVNYLNQR